MNVLTLYAHFDFYKKLLGTSLSSVVWQLAGKGYTLECYPEHCENALPYVLASFNKHQKIKVHFKEDVVCMIEIRETDEHGYLMYRKLYPEGK